MIIEYHTNLFLFSQYVEGGDEFLFEIVDQEPPFSDDGQSDNFCKTSQNTSIEMRLEKSMTELSVASTNVKTPEVIATTAVSTTPTTPASLLKMVSSEQQYPTDNTDIGMKIQQSKTSPQQQQQVPGSFSPGYSSSSGTGGSGGIGSGGFGVPPLPQYTMTPPPLSTQHTMQELSPGENLIPPKSPLPFARSPVSQSSGASTPSPSTGRLGL